VDLSLNNLRAFFELPALALSFGLACPPKPLELYSPGVAGVGRSFQP